MTKFTCSRRRAFAAVILSCAFLAGSVAFQPVVFADCGNPTGSGGCKGQTSTDVTAPAPADADDSTLRDVFSVLRDLIASLF